MTVKLLTEHNLERLSLTGGCTGSSESTLVKMPHCWKSHVTAHYFCRIPSMAISYCTLCPLPRIIVTYFPIDSLLYGFNYGTTGRNIYDGFRVPKTCFRAVDTITIALAAIVLYQNVTSSDNLCPSCLIYPN